MDPRAACESLRRENRCLLKRCAELQAEIMVEKARADAAEAWAREMMQGAAA